SEYSIYIYNDVAKTSDNLIASGTISSSDGVVNITPNNNSGVFGSFKIEYSSDQSCELQVIPKITCFKLQKYNEIWKDKDQTITNNPFIFYDGILTHTRPVIDPDIMSLD